MPPSLSHRKSPFGCQRCKRRKVKCDEGKPKCRACVRHKVECVYITPPHLDTAGQNKPVELKWPQNATVDKQQESPASSLSALLQLPTSPIGESQLELRLLHHYTAFTSLSLSPSTDIWQIHAPRLAFDYRFVFDAIMAISALHLSRNDDLRDATFHNTTPSILCQVTREFLVRALEGYQHALRQLNSQAADAKLVFEATVMAAGIVSICTLCQLGSDTPDTLGENHVDEALWVKLAMGSRQIVSQWKQVLGAQSFFTSRVFAREPDLTAFNISEVFNPDNRISLEPLLRWASQYVVLDKMDKEAYEHTLSYLGLIYTYFRTGTDSAHASYHRLMALPARVPKRFGLAVVEQQPLALTILAYVFAIMKLLEDDILWFRGIAEKQVFLIQDKLPFGWRKLIEWPMKIADGSICKDVELSVYLDNLMET